MRAQTYLGDRQAAKMALMAKTHEFDNQRGHIPARVAAQADTIVMQEAFIQSISHTAYITMVPASGGNMSTLIVKSMGLGHEGHFCSLPVAEINLCPHARPRLLLLAMLDLCFGSLQVAIERLRSAIKECHY